jgi:hypothetical protein
VARKSVLELKAISLITCLEMDFPSMSESISEKKRSTLSSTEEVDLACENFAFTSH